MKVLTVTYDTEVLEDGEFVRGETAMQITATDGAARMLMSRGEIPAADRMSAVAARNYVISILVCAERLKGRRYVPDSIKDIREDLYSYAERKE